MLHASLTISILNNQKQCLSQLMMSVIEHSLLNPGIRDNIGIICTQSNIKRPRSVSEPTFWQKSMFEMSHSGKDH